MFDIGWMELLLIGVVALIVVGPKELPVLFRTVGRYMGKARGMAREFQRSMEQAADESGLKEASDGLKAATNATRNLNLKSATKSAKSYANSVVMGDEAADGGKAGTGGTGKAAPPAEGKASVASKPLPEPEVPSEPADATAGAGKP
jgi:sec-independent protein translocase protein TatB